jgi:hypothetical protein
MDKKNGQPIKIAFDLDGVIIDKPPFIPKKVLEWLFRGGSKNSLNCHFPKSKLNQMIRKLSHQYFLRPPVKQTMELVKKLAQRLSVELYVISSRYSFLNRETEKWLAKRKLTTIFKKIYLNSQNEQPVIFKEKIVKELQPDIYIDDDQMIVNYLRTLGLKTDFYYSNSFNLGQLEKRLFSV